MHEVKRKKDKPNANSDSDEKEECVRFLKWWTLWWIVRFTSEKEKIEKLQSNCLNEMEKFAENQAYFGAKLSMEKY